MKVLVSREERHRFSGALAEVAPFDLPFSVNKISGHVPLLKHNGSWRLDAHINNLLYTMTLGGSIQI